tara:strand:- start:66 stop:1589 length:1524 start_codon:yes stop_codon:yes gene_type:complete
MANLIGIDLGTSYSVLSTLNSEGKTEIVYENDRLLPSAVHFPGSKDGNDQFFVGSSAISALDYDHKNVVIQIKKHMQDPEYKVNFHGIDYRPEDISAFILKKLLSTASKKIGEIDTATITIPAYYNDIARERTMIAAEMAGIKNPILINEPTSAALYYSSIQKKNGKVLVYDLGGGTFDVSVVEITGESTNVLSSRGDTFGGSDFNLKLYEIINEKYKNEKKVDISEDPLEHIKQYGLIERVKRILTEREEAGYTIIGQNGHLDFKISRKEFENNLSEYIMKSEMIIESVLNESGISKDQIDEILLVGGSSRIPLFQKSISNFFKKEAITESGFSVDEVVSLGASINSTLKTESYRTQEQIDRIKKINLQDVTNLYFGTIVMSESIETGDLLPRNITIIPKNSPLPCKKNREVYTVADGQEYVKFQLTQSDVDVSDPKFATIIDRGELNLGNNDRPAGQPVEIVYSYDESGILHCLVKDLGTGKELEITKNVQNQKSKINLNDIVIE